MLHGDVVAVTVLVNDPDRENHSLCSQTNCTNPSFGVPEGQSPKQVVPASPLRSNIRSGSVVAECDCQNTSVRSDVGDVHAPGACGLYPKIASEHVPGGKLRFSPKAYIDCQEPPTFT